MRSILIPAAAALLLLPTAGVQAGSFSGPNYKAEALLSPLSGIRQ